VVRMLFHALMAKARFFPFMRAAFDQLMPLWLTAHVPLNSGRGTMARRVHGLPVTGAFQMLPPVASCLAWETKTHEDAKSRSPRRSRRRSIW